MYRNLEGDKSLIVLYIYIFSRICNYRHPLSLWVVLSSFNIESHLSFLPSVLQHSTLLLGGSIQWHLFRGGKKKCCWTIIFKTSLWPKLLVPFLCEKCHFHTFERKFHVHQYTALIFQIQRGPTYCCLCIILYALTTKISQEITPASIQCILLQNYTMFGVNQYKYIHIATS